MSSDQYVALSGQITMNERLTTIAHNVANMRTAGYREETVDFDSVFSSTKTKSIAFATTGDIHISRHAGPVEATGNPLDVAVVGEGWIGVATPAGTAYTRDGRMTINEAGDLTTVTGFGVLDDGGAPIALDPARGTVEIGTDGTITQDGVVAANLGLFALAQDAKLSRYGDSAVIADREAEPIDDRTTNGFRQGYMEGSNVNPIHSITELIKVQRAFEFGMSGTRDRFQSLQQAVRTLGAE